MGRLFVEASDDHLNLASSNFGAAPFTVSLWFEANNVGPTSHNLYSEGVTTNTTEFFQITARTDVGGDPTSTRTFSSGTGGEAQSTTGITVNTWHCITAVEASASSRSAYIDGGSKGTNTTNRTPSGINRTQIGRFAGDTIGAVFDGTMNAVSGWAEALSDARILELGAGRNPLTAQTLPSMHLPLTGGIQNIISDGVTFTNVGTTEAGHKPMGW